MTAFTRDLSALRCDFPALQRLRRGKPPIFLNSTCMTLRPRSVIDAMCMYYEQFPVCGGGRSEGARNLHNWFMEELKDLLKDDKSKPAPKPRTLAKAR